MKLAIHEARKEEVYRDIARVPEAFRTDGKGTIKEGELRRIHAGPRSAFVILRGDQDSEEPTIKLDDVTRDKLGVKTGQSLEIEFDSPLFKKWRWAWNATEIGYRVAAQISLVSFVLGVIGLVLGIISLCQ